MTVFIIIHLFGLSNVKLFVLIHFMQFFLRIEKSFDHFQKQLQYLMWSETNIKKPISPKLNADGYTMYLAIITKGVEEYKIIIQKQNYL